MWLTLIKGRYVARDPEIVYLSKRYFRDIAGSLRRVEWISFGPGAELLDLDNEFWSLVRVKG